MTEIDLIGAVPILIAAVAALLLSAPLVEGIRAWTLRRSLIDVPNERSSHTTPMPRGGGIAISGLTLLGFGAAASLWHFDVRLSLAFIAGAALVAAVSFIDDVRSLSAATRMTAQIAAAALIVAGRGWWRSIDFGQLSIPLGMAGIVVTIVWIVGLTNAYNFMDGIDGIAGTQAAIAAAGWIAIGCLTGNAAMTILAALVAGSSVGFLTRNWPPARIFMGDVGSAFLGFTFAAIPFLGGAGAPRLAVPAVLMIWPFLFDTALTFFRRVHRRENIFRAHRSHLYQRLNIAGYPQRFVTVLYGAFALFTAGLALLALRLDGRGAALALAAALLAGGGIWRFVLYVERRQARSSPISAAIP